jgi:hypothetical protein
MGEARTFPLHGGFGRTKTLVVGGLATISAKVAIDEEGNVTIVDLNVGNDILEWHSDALVVAHDNLLADGQCCSHEHERLTEEDWEAIENIAEALPNNIGCYEGPLR